LVVTLLSLASARAEIVKAVLDARQGAQNLINASAWRGFAAGFETRDGVWVCDNGSDAKAKRGVTQHVVLNQTAPQPIVASAWSRAAGVTGGRDSNYALYLDLAYADGTSLWGQIASFDVGTHDWQRREVTVLPEKPVKSLTFNLLLRGHGGRAEFRDAELRTVEAPAGACLFDGVPVIPKAAPAEGFQVRDVAAGSDFVRLDHEALGLKLETKRNGEFIEATLRNRTGKDRAVTLIYAVPVSGDGWRWLAGPGQSEATVAGREYMVTHGTPAGMGRLSRWPFAAISDGKHGAALGIDMEQPAFFRAGYNAGTHELFLAFDLGLTPEQPSAHLRFCQFAFDPAWEFRSALARFYELFPSQFQRRVAQQGLWMPFAKISKVAQWEDFGFRFKEGNDETKWDDAHDILTFRYTEPMTWWMKMPKELPRTLDAALAEAKRLAAQSNTAARAFLASGFRDDSGRTPARLLDTPWCNGAVWSMNSMPGVAGEVTDFSQKWNAKLREQLYGAARKDDLDGEYVDSAECYVTDVLNFRRDHFAAAQTPLTFAPGSHQPALFRGLMVFEYVRTLGRDVHGMHKLMMANSTPSSLCWLAPQLDVLGTETDWNHGGQWRPMSADELLYRRALCRGKPYCFLMNSDFIKLSHELVEKYMRRCLAIGMFPGFFSADASTGAYFTRPELYERDRDLFKKYVPLCKRVAEAGWEPVTRAWSSDAQVLVERFGEKHLTVFNAGAAPCTVTITLDAAPAATSRELISGAPLTWKERTITLTLAAEDVQVLELR
jgi:hypothetical protein